MFAAPPSPCQLKWKTICTDELLGAERPFHRRGERVMGVAGGQFILWTNMTAAVNASHRLLLEVTRPHESDKVKQLKKSGSAEGLKEDAGQSRCSRSITSCSILQYLFLKRNENILFYNNI